ncbi:helix-turn-helix domain-containing protein [Herbiconiux moechotypicola]|uniref:Helix-turn-helix transcriptional regulator n=1 Tax=Herbiconiux moechotypicola TaxID=637393 RepID=A0ABN3DEF8_9MICO|nr:helix-turn-helix domain-containing protein [Herbiconiux moechotypicola]MCS5729308.1 helix-turn-helix domain-containing protein [Herbiconiux moechotypicola]
MSAAMHSPLGDYLRARRAAVRPEDVGLAPIGVRRVDGLRRDEVARLAGVSQEYYIRLEQGRDRQPSLQVLQALARPLKLDAGGIDYMQRLVHIQSGGRRGSDPAALAEALDSGLRSLLDQWPATPAYILDRNLTVVMANSRARHELPGGWEPGANAALIVFSESWRKADRHWSATAEHTVAALRYSSDPADPELRDLVGLLSLREPDFAELWGRHEASPITVRELTVELVGGRTAGLTEQGLVVPGERGHTVVVLHASATATRRLPA